LSKTFQTGYISVSNGQTTNLDLSNYSRLISTQVKWKGQQVSSGYTYSTNTNSNSGTSGAFDVFPAVPSGYSFYKHYYSFSCTFRNDDPNLSGQVWIEYDVPGEGVKTTSPVVINSEETKTISASGYVYSNHVNEIATVAGRVSSSYISVTSGSVTLKTTGRKTSYIQTQNPSTVINGQTTTHSGTLNDGVESTSYTLSGLVVGQNNSILHNISGSGKAYIDITYVVEMKPIVSTLDPTNVSYSTATLNGNLSDTGGESTNVYIEYGLTQSYGTVVDLGVATEGSFNTNVTGLSYGKTYYYRAYATNSQGTTYGAQKTFTTLYPYLSSPTHSSPTDGSKTKDRNPYFEFTLNSRSDSENTGNVHARVRISNYLNMVDPIVIESKDSQTNWEYWSGSAWTAFPAGGVPQGSKVRLKPINSLPIGTLYWDTAAYDGTHYGSNSTPWSVRILISVEDLYVLLVDNKDYKAVNISVIEASNGQVGSINFTLKNADKIRNNLAKSSAMDKDSDGNGVVDDFTSRIQGGVTGNFSLDTVNKAQKIDAAYSTSSGNAQIYQDIPAKGGDIFSISVEGMVGNIVGNSYGNIAVTRLDSNHGYLSTLTDKTFSNTGFTTLKIENIVVPADTAYIRVRLQANTYSGSITVTYRNLLIEKSSTVGNYIPSGQDWKVKYGDEVKLAVNDVLGNTEEFKGVVRDKAVDGYFLTVKAPTGAGVLSERLIKVDYTPQDIGVTVKAIIDTYCTPLTSTNVNTTTGISAPITAKGKTPLKILEEIRRQYGISYFVDKDWDVHLYQESDIADSKLTVRFGGAN